MLETRREYGLAYTLSFLAKVVLEQGDHERALDLYKESVRILREVSDKRPIAECLEGMANVACMQGQAERAARLYGAAATLRAAIGAPMSPSERPVYDRMFAAVRNALGDQALSAYFAAGEIMGLEQAIEYALCSP
jgi:non-specific serine/threonine protein kinase